MLSHLKNGYLELFLVGIELPQIGTTLICFPFYYEGDWLTLYIADTSRPTNQKIIMRCCIPTHINLLNLIGTVKQENLIKEKKVIGSRLHFLYPFIYLPYKQRRAYT
jgi:hypothetical protein